MPLIYFLEQNAPDFGCLADQGRGLFLQSQNGRGVGLQSHASSCSGHGCEVCQNQRCKVVYTVRLWPVLIKQATRFQSRNSEVRWRKRTRL